MTGGVKERPRVKEREEMQKFLCKKAGSSIFDEGDLFECM